jgi:hypothetical protein
MTEAVFAGRMTACAVLTVMAAGKLLAPRASSRALWRPSWLGPSAALAAVLAVSAVELSVAFVLHVGLGPSWARALGAALLGMAVSAVGWLSARGAGGCGCGGAMAARRDGRSLLSRNALLFGALVAGSLLGPSWTSLQAGASSLRTVAAVTPLAILVALAARGVARRRLVERHGLGVAPAAQGGR